MKRSIKKYKKSFGGMISAKIMVGDKQYLCDSCEKPLQTFALVGYYLTSSLDLKSLHYLCDSNDFGLGVRWCLGEKTFVNCSECWKIAMENNPKRRE